MRTVVYIVYPLASDDDEGIIQHDDIHVFTSDRAAENWVYRQMKDKPGLNWEIRPVALDDPIRDMVLKPRRIQGSTKAASTDL
jgi:hypothetical protein